MILLLSICSVLAAALAEGETPPTTTTTESGQQINQIRVTIDQGDVIGSDATDGNYFEFHGIPYADSTAGKNRFQAPSTPPKFKTTFEANRKNIKCVRALGQGYEGTEDCLVANVFTPTLDTTKNLPVMVWIKGKEFDRQNEQDVSFRNFVQKEVVVVSLNYRESILGFLCLGTPDVPGNAGLKDIIAGLKWVKQNIAQFGGNPKNITLIGHGSGAAAADLVTMSPMGKDLVQRAIAQSGSALAPWAVSRDNLKYALIVAEALGHKIESIEQLSGIFNRANVSALMGIINELDLTDNSLAFAPCVERKDLEGVEPFLTKTPAEIISQGEFDDIPMIFGFVDNEGTIRAKEAQGKYWIRRMQEDFTDFIPPDLQFESDEDEKTVTQEIRQYYSPENEKINETEYLKYHGDTMILVSAVREARNRMNHSANARFYLYQFSYSGTLEKPFVPIDLDSAAHSEELTYMFDTSDTEPLNLNQTMRNILVERWTNFAKTGFPSSTTSEVSWFPITELNYNFIRQLTVSEIEKSKTIKYEAALQDPHPCTISFWDRIYTTNFRDAQSNWSLDNKGDDETPSSTPAGDEDTISGTSDDPAASTSTPTPDEATTANPNSASTAIAYTFLIVSLFSLLSHLHSSLILS